MSDEMVLKVTPTRTTRVAGDLAEKLEELLPVLGVASAEYLDPLIRSQIENDFAANLKAVKARRRAEEATREAREARARLLGELPEMANDLGEAGA